MMKSSPTKWLLFVLLLASMTLAGGARVWAAQAEPAAPGDLLDPSIPPLSNGAPATPKPAGDGTSAPPLGSFAPTAADAPAINVWYGAAQTFGLNGDPQKWINILGNVSSAVPLSTLTYTLNGGPAQLLTVGANGSRLVQAGDFNIELDYTDLLPGNNTVVITATDQSAGVQQANVAVNYQGGGVTWTPQTYTINWAAATKVNDVAQVVDGQWVISGGAARPTVHDFDRLVAIGDLSWRDYTVTVPVTVHSINTNKSPGLGVMVRWQGHFDAENGIRPYVGWRRLGAMGWYRYEKGTPPTEGLQLLGHRGLELGTKPFTLTVGATYIYKINVTSAADSTKPATYRFKVWDSTQPEPALWDIESQGISGEPRSGSVLLVAHHADASFGNVTVELASTEPKPELTLGTSGSGGGTVTPNPQKASYRFGEDVLLTAAPNVGSSFQGWLGDVTGMTNPTTVEMFGDRSVKALFVDPNVQTPISDDFNDCTLNEQIWTFINPLGDATLTMTGGQAQISVPAGSSHDIWSGGRNAPRIMQYAEDDNFDLVVKFDSAMSQKNESQGILIEENNLKFMRFNFLHDGGTYRIQAYTFVNGAPEAAKVNAAITMGAPMYLRVQRFLTSDAWNLSYSTDGTTWQFAAAFQFDMAVSAYGVFAGNSSQNPAHDGLIDYFFNKNLPIAPEDPDRRLNITTNGSGTVTPSVVKENYACDEAIQLTANPLPGFIFQSWGGDLGGSTNPAPLVMNSTKNVIANFVTDVQYTLTVTPNGAGTVEKSPDQTTYSAGQKVLLTAKPNLGNTFVNWTGGINSATNPVEVTVNSDLSITANFAAAPPRTLTVLTNGNGSVDKNPNQTTFLHGEHVFLTPVPGANASFTGWSDDAGGATVPLDVLMDGDKTITANFADNVYTLTITPDPNGTVTPSHVKPAYYHGEVVTLTPTPAAGYKFNGWTGDLGGAAVPGQLTMTKNSTVAAIFIPAGTYTVNVTIAEGQGSVTRNLPGPDYNYGDEVILTAVPGPGFEFMNWSGDLEGTETPATIVVTSDMNIAAHFAGEGIYDLNILPSVNGSIQAMPVRDLYAQDQLVTLTAVPAPGYVLAAWGNDASGTTSPYILVMNGNKTVSATFAVAPQYTLNLTSNGEGTATVDPPGTQFIAGTTITLTATADPGYVFTGWSGDLGGNSNPAILTMDGPKSIVANFVENTAVLSHDFDGCAGLDPLWSWADPLGQAQYELNGRQVLISVPPAANYETSRKVHTAAQLTQPVADTDFAVLVRFESMLSQQYQFQGIVIQQDENDLVRVEMSYDAGGLRFSAVTFENGVGKTRKTQLITQTDSDAFMLVRRTGDKFQVYYRDQETDKWINIGSFNHILDVAEMGIFASSYGVTGTPAPGHTAVFDYFFNEDAPIEPEDADVPGLEIITAGQGTVARSPESDAYTCGQVVNLTANPAQGWRFVNWSGALNGSSATLPLTISGRHTVTATFAPVTQTGFKLYLPAAIR